MSQLALQELEAQARARVDLSAGGRYWRNALTFAVVVQRARRERKPEGTYLAGSLSSFDLRELAAGLPPQLRAIAAGAAPASADAGPLMFYPVLPWGPPLEYRDREKFWSAQKWCCGLGAGRKPQQFMSTHRGLSAIFCSLIAPGQTIDGTAFLAPHRQKAVRRALDDLLGAAVAKIRTVNPRLASALIFTHPSPGQLRYAGAAQIHVPQSFFNSTID